MVLTGNIAIHIPRSISTLHVKYTVYSQRILPLLTSLQNSVYCGWHVSTDNTVGISIIMKLLFNTINNSFITTGTVDIVNTNTQHTDYVKGPWGSTQQLTWPSWLPVTFERWHLQKIRISRHRMLLNAHRRIATARTTTAFICGSFIEAASNLSLHNIDIFVHVVTEPLNLTHCTYIKLKTTALICLPNHFATPSTDTTLQQPRAESDRASNGMATPPYPPHRGGACMTSQIDSGDGYSKIGSRLKNKKTTLKSSYTQNV